MTEIKIINRLEFRTEDIIVKESVADIYNMSCDSKEIVITKSLIDSYGELRFFGKTPVNVNDIMFLREVFTLEELKENINRL